MKIGVPKEIKIHEYRVGLVPAGVRELVDAGHQVLVQVSASKIRIINRRAPSLRSAPRTYLRPPTSSSR